MEDGGGGERREGKERRFKQGRCTAAYYWKEDGCFHIFLIGMITGSLKASGMLVLRRMCVDIIGEASICRKGL